VFLANAGCISSNPYAIDSLCQAMVLYNAANVTLMYTTLQSSNGGTLTFEGLYSKYVSTSSKSQILMYWDPNEGGPSPLLIAPSVDGMHDGGILLYVFPYAAEPFSFNIMPIVASNAGTFPFNTVQLHGDSIDDWTLAQTATGNTWAIGVVRIIPSVSSSTGGGSGSPSSGGSTSQVVISSSSLSSSGSVSSSTAVITSTGNGVLSSSSSSSTLSSSSTGTVAELCLGARYLNGSICLPCPLHATTNSSITNIEASSINECQCLNDYQMDTTIWKCIELINEPITISTSEGIGTATATVVTVTAAVSVTSSVIAAVSATSAASTAITATAAGTSAASSGGGLLSSISSVASNPQLTAIALLAHCKFISLLPSVECVSHMTCDRYHSPICNNAGSNGWKCT
jgi:hypothetical protein